MKKAHERAVTVAIFAHVMHNLNSFFDAHPAEGYADEGEAGAAFFEFIGQRDAKLSHAREMTLRRLLWEHHECPPEYRYGDDGEMVCSYCLIDFRLATAQHISELFLSAKLRKLTA